MLKKILKNKFYSLILASITLLVFITLGFYGYKNYSRPTQKIESSLKKIDSRPDEIRGKIITLKRLRPEYFTDFYTAISPKKVIKPLYLPSDKEKIVKHLEKQLEKEAAGKILFYTVFDNTDNKLIGYISIREKNDLEPGQFSCAINDQYWGGGRIQEAIKIISDLYFKLTNEKSFNAHVEMWNLRSYYGLKKAGFKLVKTFYPQGQHPRYILNYYNPNNPHNPGENMSKKVLFILMPQDYRDEEFTEPYKILSDKKYQIDVAGFTQDLAKGVIAHEFKPNKLLDSLEAKDFDLYDALVIPGGPGSVKYLWNNEKIMKIIKYFYENKKIVAAICYAVIPLVQTGILKDKNATVFPSDEAKDILKKHDVIFIDQGVVSLIKERIITAQGPKFAKNFGQAVIDMLEK